MSKYSDKKPTEAGYYWVKLAGGPGYVSVVQLCNCGCGKLVFWSPQGFAGVEVSDARFSEKIEPPENESDFEVVGFLGSNSSDGDSPINEYQCPKCNGALNGKCDGCAGTGVNCEFLDVEKYLVALKGIVKRYGDVIKWYDENGEFIGIQSPCGVAKHSVLEFLK